MFWIKHHITALENCVFAISFLLPMYHVLLNNFMNNLAALGKKP